MSITLIYQELQDYDVPTRAQIMIPLLDKNLTPEI